MTEAELQVAVARYISTKYPNVMFHSDYGSGIKLRPYQAKMQKMQNGGRRAWPDMFIAEPRPRCIDGAWKYEWNGLFIELKKEGTRIKKRNGEWASEHIKEQAIVLYELQNRGYKADFAIGLDQAINLIDEYLGGNNDNCYY